jgi:hypothetical protein
MGWHRMTLDSVHWKNTPFWIGIAQGWHGMTQDDTRHISCCKTFYFALIMHRDDMGWHGMTAGCLPHLKHAFCIEIASKSIWDDKWCHWTMCPAKNMKVRIWFPKDDMGWHRMILDSFYSKNTPFWIGNAQGWHGMTKDESWHISCWKPFFFALILHRDDMEWHGMTPGCLPHLKHAFCIEIAAMSIWDDTGCHWPMCPANSMKFRIWFPKDDMGWHRMPLDSVYIKNTIFLIGNAQGWHGMTQDDTRHNSCCNTFYFALIMHRDDMGWHGMTWDDMGWQQAVCHTLSMHFAKKLPPSQYGMTQDDTGPCALQKPWNLRHGMTCDDMGWHWMTAGCLPHLKNAFCIAIVSKSIWDDTICHWTMCPAKNMKVRIWFPKDDMGWHRMPLDSLHCKNTPFLIGNAQRWQGMTQDESWHNSCWKTFYFALILHKDDMGWHGMMPGCLHRNCLQVNMGWHRMTLAHVPCKNMKFRVWFPKDDMGWHRMTLDSLHCKNTLFLIGNAQGWHGMTQDESWHIKCWKPFYFASILHRDDMGWQQAVCHTLSMHYS